MKLVENQQAVHRWGKSGCDDAELWETGRGEKIPGLSCSSRVLELWSPASLRCGHQPYQTWCRGKFCYIFKQSNLNNFFLAWSFDESSAISFKFFSLLCIQLNRWVLVTCILPGCSKKMIKYNFLPSSSKSNETHTALFQTFFLEFNSNKNNSFVHI